MNIKNVYILEDRGILFVNGLDAKEFLQNLVISTNYSTTDQNDICINIIKKEMINDFSYKNIKIQATLVNFDV